MTQLSTSPRPLKGALIYFRPPVPTPAVIPFQINPEGLSRQVDARNAEGGEGTETFRLAGAPHEKYTVDATFDATDDLETGDRVTQTLGLHPRLAALEMLVYPHLARVIENEVLLNAGVVEILPMQAPFTVFVWGAARILPVRLDSFAITEEAYDPNLNPIRVKVSMELTVLSYSDLSITHPGHAMFLAHQAVKETMAAIGQARGLGAVLGADVKLL